ncbi:MAG TPA: HD domain-containing protein [Feifaniaceae bacterium]|nr:HD domain-containing protein [Feifaniaceae bacterium]
MTRADPLCALYWETGRHLLHDTAPSAYLEEVSNAPAFQRHPFCMLHRLKSTEQSPIHHPEGSVWNHTLLVVDFAAQARAQSRDPAAFMWAALLHDIGKPGTTKNRKGKITSYDHDKLGEKLGREFLETFTEDHAFIRRVCALIRYHMQILFVVNDLPFADISGMLRSADIEEVALLGLCDRLGRTNGDREKEEAVIALFLRKCGR